MKRYAFHLEADEEYALAAEYYAGIEPELGRRFHDEIERLILDVRRQPQRFRPYDATIRRHFSDVFPYALLYVDAPDRVLIIAVMHMKRTPATGATDLSEGRLDPVTGALIRLRQALPVAESPILPLCAHSSAG